MFIPRFWQWLAFIILLIIIGRIGLLRGDINANIETTDTLSQQLFLSLKSKGLLKVSADGLLALPPADQALADQANNAGLGLDKQASALLEELYSKIQGQRVQKQIALWNLGHRLAAVRDDRPQQDQVNLWKVMDATTQRPVESMEVVPAAFVYVGGDTLRAGFHDWRSGYSLQNNPLTFQTTIEPSKTARTLHIQTIGRLTNENALLQQWQAYKIKIEARKPEKACADAPIQAQEITLSLPPSSKALTISLNLTMASNPSQQLDGVAICLLAPHEEPQETNHCRAKKPTVQDAATDSDEVIASPADEESANSPTSSSQPTSINSTDINKILNLTPSSASTLDIRPTPTTTTSPVSCKTAVSLENYHLQWESERLYVSTTNPLRTTNQRYFTLYTLDQLNQGKPSGEALTIETNQSNVTQEDKHNNSGKPTAFTETAGLLPLIGQDNSDVYALSGLINSAAPYGSTQVYLSLHSKIQTIAQNALNAALKEDQQGAIVLLDPQTGAILAAANGTQTKLASNINSWDRIAFSQTYPLKDPTQFNPWQGETGFNAPGSTFKLVTALAGLATLKEGGAKTQKLQHMLAGVKQDQFRAVTDLDPASSNFVIPAKTLGIANDVVISNFKNNIYPNGIPIQAAFALSNEVGLKEALRDSINNWFIQLATIIDSPVLPNGEQTHLARMAVTLGFNQPSQTAEGQTLWQPYFQLAPANLGLKRYLARNSSRGDVLNALGGRLDSQNPRANLVELAQNSIGQGMTTSPLQLARVAASIATGKVVQPYLIAYWNEQDLYADGDYPPATDLDLPHLDWLHAGMKAVVDVGTAHSAFKHNPPLAKHVYGKTGTSQVKRGQAFLGNSAWFVGFYTPDKPKAATLAFACQVTHATGGGGQVCAPIIRDILQNLATNQLLDKRYAP